MIERMINLQHLFAYNAWANKETLNALKRAINPPPKTLDRMGHLIGAEEIWLARLCHEPSTTQVWPSIPLEKCGRHLEVLHQGWLAYLDTLDDDSSLASIQYTNSKGESYESRVDDVLMHVLAHAAYHRGQIASDLRAAGDTPAITDFIYYTREGLK